MPKKDVTEYFKNRTMQIVEMLTQGMSVPEIADELGSSFNTIRFHLFKLYRIEGVKNSAQLIAKYFREGKLK